MLVMAAVIIVMMLMAMLTAMIYGNNGTVSDGYADHSGCMV
jgi:hypothetical protein